MPTPAGQSPVVACDRARRGAPERRARRARRGSPPARRPRASRRARRRPSSSDEHDARPPTGSRSASASAVIAPPPPRPRARARRGARARASCSASSSATSSSSRDSEGLHDAQDEHEQQRGDREPDDDRGQRHRLAERVAHVALGQRVDRRGAARQARGDQRQHRRLRDQHDAEHDADQVAVEQQVGAGAEQGRGGERERRASLRRPPRRAARGGGRASPARRRRAGRRRGRRPRRVISSSVPILTTVARPGPGRCVNGGSPSSDRAEADREREQQPAGRDDRRVAQDGQARARRARCRT